MYLRKASNNNKTKTTPHSIANNEELKGNRKKQMEREKFQALQLLGEQGATKENIKGSVASCSTPAVPVRRGLTWATSGV